MIAVSSLRFSVIEMQGVHAAILNFYFLLLGVMTALSQIDVKIISRNFRFINYHWGKALFCLFLVSISMSDQEDTFLQWINAIYFLGLAIAYIVLAIADR